MDFLDKLKGFLLNPVETFNQTKEDSITDAIKFFLPLLLVFAVLLGVLAILGMAAMGSMMGEFMPLGMLGGGALAVMTIIFTIIALIVGIFIDGVIVHIFAYLMGARNGIGQTIKAVIYGCAPLFLIGWIPTIGIIGVVWSFVLEVIGIREYHEISTGRAVIALILPVIIIVILMVVFFISIIGSLMSMGGGPSPYMM